MKYIYLIIIAFSIHIYTTAQQPSISLNGRWNFFASNTQTEYEVLANYQIHWDRITVPGNWDVMDKYATYVGKGYYQREFEVPVSWKGRQVYIKFDAVYQTSKVWVNGKQLGEHIGGYTPFEYNISDIVNYDKPNTVLVMADNSYKRGAWWAWGGISRDVSLNVSNDVRMIYQHITAIPDFDANSVKFIFKYKLENNSCKNYKGRIISKTSDKSDPIITKISLDGHQTKTEEVTFENKLSDYELWDFDNPKLYTLNSKLEIKGKVFGSLSNQFGIRKLEARGEQLFLNNKVVRMNGINRIHDHPLYGNTEPDQLVKQDMLDIKSMAAILPD
ncbi:glycoside hydrolase family 2 protein [Saccharicrinis fermentans]|uniref:Beta-galactosidase n=1 Tax=Saccharicrinis fermentans DSM 9555 = JCM 21142 TaxID=869213 RepID=W7Y9M2_9BACT|nr:sugar-binding domain-containing protein [Saccharicrinis fermentans]GAF05032.1 beta-galactosidase [Saccharicrinis fermentans DSM 9555 = JCM 21142]